MSKIDLYDPKWVDMVFADKNKAYGAYQLRKSVSQRNIKALVILLVAAFIGGGYLAYQIKKHKDELAAQEAYAAKMELAALAQAKKEQAERKKQQKKEEPKKVEPEKVVPETRATVKFTAPVIKDDKDVKEEMPPMVKMNKETKAIGTETKAGVEDRNIVADRSTVATPEQIIPKIEKPVVKFVVGRDGSVSRAEVVRGVDPALDREALRVVNSMPKWNPGMNNGQPANVWFQLPITFKLN